MSANDAPNWISAIATAFGALITTGTLVAAGIAARWTARTATAAREQVDAVRQQVDAEREQLELAKQEATRQLALTTTAEKQAREAAERERDTAEAAEARFLRTRLDTLAPTVYCRATLGRDTSSIPMLRNGPTIPAITVATMGEVRADPESLFQKSYAVAMRRIVEPDEQLMFGIAATFEFVNCADIPARVDIVSWNSGEFADMNSGRDLFIPPRERRYALWTKRLPSWHLTADEIMTPEHSTLRVDYWVRDLGQSTRDSFTVIIDLRYFERDGSRLVANPNPAFRKAEYFGEQIEDRHYDRLEPPSED